MTVGSIAPLTAAEASALTLAADVPNWARGRSKVDGTPFYLAPSRTVTGVAHRCTSYGCTCRGFERYGRCAHSRAVQLHEQHERDIERAFAEVARRARSAETFDRLFGGPDFD